MHVFVYDRPQKKKNSHKNVNAKQAKYSTHANLEPGLAIRLFCIYFFFKFSFVLKC